MTNNTPIQTPQPITVLHRKIPELAGVKAYKHSFVQFIYIEQGVLSVINEQGRYLVPPKQGIVIPANIEHELFAKTEVNLSIVYFAEAEVEDFIKQTQVVSISNFLSTLLIESKKIEPNYQWQSSDGRLLRLIRDKISQAHPLDTFLPYPKDERLTNITEKLLKHPSLKSDLISWGKFVSVSSRTLTRVFKKETGITYSEWRQRLNIQIAIKHLALGENITNIAKLLGYESSSAFIYMFKKQMGISPNRFLKSQD